MTFLNTTDYAVSGWILDGLQPSIGRLVQLTQRSLVIQVNVWGAYGHFYDAKFDRGATEADVVRVLQMAAEGIARVGIVVRLPLEETFTHIAITLDGRDGWTLVEGQLYFEPVSELASSEDGVRRIVEGLLDVCEGLEVSLLNVIDEDVSPPIDETPIREPVLASIFDPKLFASLVPARMPDEGRAVIWFIEPHALVAGGAPDDDALRRFRVALRAADIRTLLAKRSSSR